jgi:hypothetical protein
VSVVQYGVREGTCTHIDIHSEIEIQSCSKFETTTTLHFTTAALLRRKIMPASGCRQRKCAGSSTVAQARQHAPASGSEREKPRGPIKIPFPLASAHLFLPPPPPPIQSARASPCTPNPLALEGGGGVLQRARIPVPRPANLLPSACLPDGSSAAAGGVGVRVSVGLELQLGAAPARLLARAIWGHHPHQGLRGGPRLGNQQRKAPPLLRAVRGHPRGRRNH